MLREDGRDQAPITGRLCAPTDTDHERLKRLTAKKILDRIGIHGVDPQGGPQEHESFCQPFRPHAEQRQKFSQVDEALGFSSFIFA